MTLLAWVLAVGLCVCVTVCVLSHAGIVSRQLCTLSRFPLTYHTLPFKEIRVSWAIFKGKELSPKSDSEKLAMAHKPLLSVTNKR